MTARHQFAAKAAIILAITITTLFPYTARRILNTIERHLFEE